VTSSGTVTESSSNSGNAGSDKQELSISGGIIGTPQNIDFTGKGTPERVPFIELRSPVREGDQYTIWDRHYADTNIDVDGDKKPEALDVAVYGRVIGLETLSFQGLPVLSTVRVDTTVRARITLSSNGQVSPVSEAVIQTWYARGIGIVRQRSSTPTETGGDVEIVDEQLSSWDGITEGFGAMAAQTDVVPVTGVTAGSVAWIRGTAGFRDHALVVMAGPYAAESTIARLDKRGRVVSSRIQANMPAGSEGLVLPHRQGLLYLRQLQTQYRMTSIVELTRFDENGALVGNFAGATIDLTGPRTDPMLEPVKAAVDGTTLWLLWSRIYNTPIAQERELILRPYTLEGEPLGPELVVDPKASTAARIAGVGGRVLLTWGRFGNGYEAVYASVALGDKGVTVLPFASGMPTTTVTESGLLLPRAGGTSGALLWTMSLSPTPPRTTAGVLLDSNQSPVRAGSSLADEVLAGVPMLQGYSPAVDSTPDSSLLVLSVDNTVSWVTMSANKPLSTRQINQVSLIDTSADQHVVFDDRVLVLRAVPQGLMSAVVWLNSGVAP
jgi:hypothetical protein